MSRYASQDVKARRERRQQGRWVPDLWHRIVTRMRVELVPLAFLLLGWIIGQVIHVTR